MPRFTPNPSAVASSIPLIRKDTVRLKLGEPKAAERQKGDLTVYGVNFPLTIVEVNEDINAKLVGKNVFFFGEWNNEDGSPAQFAGVTKQFIMAALGYNPRDNQDEERFDRDFADADWSYDSDSKTVGDFWMNLMGKGIEVDTDVANGKGEKASTEYQRFNNWRPTSA